MEGQYLSEGGHYFCGYITKPDLSFRYYFNFNRKILQLKFTENWCNDLYFHHKVGSNASYVLMDQTGKGY